MAAALWLGILSAASVQEEVAARPPVPDVELPFPVGEKLTYIIYWGWIAVGESVASTEWAWVEDSWKLRIHVRTQSNGVLSALYPVDDRIETLVDPVTLRPVRFRMILNQGDRHRHETTVFDWDAMQAHFVRKRKDRENETKTYTIKSDTRDLASFMYFLRKTDFEPKTVYEFEVMSDEKLYDLTVTTREEERIRLETYGRVPSLRMDPKAEFQGAVIKRGEMRVWISSEGRQLMTKMFVDTPFANIRLLLKSVEGPGAEDWQKEE
jgi:hypothetical protein